MTNATIAILQKLLKHQPASYGTMIKQTEQEYKQSKKKYHEYKERINTELLAAHIAGTTTIAVPNAANGLASTITLDVDAEAFERVPIIMETARTLGLWAWGEIHTERNRGYVYIPFSGLTNAEALRNYGDHIIAAAGYGKVNKRQLDNRTANQAITRLPFARHTWTNTRGLIVFQDGTDYDLNHDLDAGLAAWREMYHENDTAKVPASPEKRRNAETPKRGNATTHAQIKEAFNNTFDVCQILEQHHGRRHSRTSWHCPCGQHNNNDHEPSLLIVAAKNEKYGEYLVQGYQATCKFHASRGEAWDSFNVDMQLAGRSYKEQIAYAAQILKLNLTERHQSDETSKSQPNYHAERRPRRAVPPAQTEQPAEQAQSIKEKILFRAALDTTLRPASRKVLAYMFEAAGNRTWCRKSLASIIAATGLARRTVQLALRQLEQSYIKTDHTGNEHGGDDTNIYTFMIAPQRSEHAPELKLNTCTKTKVKHDPSKGGQPLDAPDVRPEPPAMQEPERPDQAAGEPEPSDEPPPLRYIKPRRVIRTIDDLADSVREREETRKRGNTETPQEPEPPAVDLVPDIVPILPQETKAEPANDDAPAGEGATFTPVPDGFYFDLDLNTLMPLSEPTSQERYLKTNTQLFEARRADDTKRTEQRAIQRNAETPKRGNAEMQDRLDTGEARNWTKLDGLYITRRDVDRLRAAAMKLKTKHAWNMYHREKKRLEQMERRIAKQTPAEPVKRKRRSNVLLRTEAMQLGL